MILWLTDVCNYGQNSNTSAIRYIHKGTKPKFQIEMQREKLMCLI